MDPNSIIQKIQESLGQYKANDLADLPSIISGLVKDRKRLEATVTENSLLQEELDLLEDIMDGSGFGMDAIPLD